MDLVTDEETVELLTISELRVRAAEYKEMDKEFRESSTKLRRKDEFRVADRGTSAGCMHPPGLLQARLSFVSRN